MHWSTRLVDNMGRFFLQELVGFLLGWSLTGWLLNATVPHLVLALLIAFIWMHIMLRLGTGNWQWHPCHWLLRSGSYILVVEMERDALEAFCRTHLRGAWALHRSAGHDNRYGFPMFLHVNRKSDVVILLLTGVARVMSTPGHGEP